MQTIPTGEKRIAVKTLYFFGIHAFLKRNAWVNSYSAFRQVKMGIYRNLLPKKYMHIHHLSTDKNNLVHRDAENEFVSLLYFPQNMLSSANDEKRTIYKFRRKISCREIFHFWKDAI